MRLEWLPDVIRGAGGIVHEEGDWYSRGSDSFNPRAVMLHHDASAPGSSPSGPSIMINGTSSVPGPLCQLWFDYFGEWHVIAGGRANHAGSGDGWGVVRAGHGNEDSIGIEIDHTTGEAWTSGQASGGGRVLRALLDRLGAEAHNALTAHKEYAAGRKVDPDPLDMDWLRGVVAGVPSGGGDDDVPTGAQMIELTKSGAGYWIVDSVGAVFCYGDAYYYGGANDVQLAAPIVAIRRTESGAGYFLLAQDGGVFTYGDAKYDGAPTGHVH
ncbi:MAG: N-acetylmuramoyl-L-alanine amidase [Aeromicrobium sp.]